jgi:peptidoglycan/LPS O-acetylase OafA/YrhL
VCVFVLSIVLAYLCLKLYDEPIRKYLAKRFLGKKR